MSSQYDAQASAVADGNGRAVARIDAASLQRWEVLRISVSAPAMSTVVIVPARVYRNIESPSNLISATRTGQLDTDDQPRCQLAPGETLICVWQDLTPGVQATLTVSYSIG